MTGKRSKLETYLEILQVINKGENKPTRIMYKANLSWIPLQQFFDSMISQDLIEEVSTDKRKEYMITVKGREVLRYFDRMKNMIRIDMKLPKYVELQKRNLTVPDARLCRI